MSPGSIIDYFLAMLSNFEVVIEKLGTFKTRIFLQRKR